MAMKRNTIVVAVVAALVLSACGSDKKSVSPTTVKGKAGAAVTVSTAASLEGVVITLMQAFNKANPSLRIPLPPKIETAAVLAGSVARSTPGVDILPTGSIKKVGATATKSTFGRNIAVIAVAAANPHNVTGLNAFAATSGLKVTACGPKSQLVNGPFLVLLKAKIKPAAGSVIFDCRKVMADIVTGKLDAALLYRAGLTPPKSIKLLTVPAAQDLPTLYSIVLVGKNPRAAAFGKFVASSAGQAILKLRGYLP
jgi:ABC-type molybdate transport system substrate-binding protein